MSIYAPKTFQQVTPLIEERQKPRAGLYLPIFILLPECNKASALLTDVSQDGCNIAVATPMMVGKYLAVEVPGLSRFKGSVVWQTRDELGLDFAAAISRAEVDYIVELAVRNQ